MATISSPTSHAGPLGRRSGRDGDDAGAGHGGQGYGPVRGRRAPSLGSAGRRPASGVTTWSADVDAARSMHTADASGSDDAARRPARPVGRAVLEPDAGRATPVVDSPGLDGEHAGRSASWHDVEPTRPCGVDGGVLDGGDAARRVPRSRRSRSPAPCLLDAVSPTAMPSTAAAGRARLPLTASRLCGARRRVADGRCGGPRHRLAGRRSGTRSPASTGLRRRDGSRVHVGVQSDGRSASPASAGRADDAVAGVRSRLRPPRRPGGRGVPAAASASDRQPRARTPSTRLGLRASALVVRCGVAPGRCRSSPCLERRPPGRGAVADDPHRPTGPAGAGHVDPRVDRVDGAAYVQLRLQRPAAEVDGRRWRARRRSAPTVRGRRRRSARRRTSPAVPGARVRRHRRVARPAPAPPCADAADGRGELDVGDFARRRVASPCDAAATGLTRPDGSSGRGAEPRRRRARR